MATMNKPRCCVRRTSENSLTSYQLLFIAAIYTLTSSREPRPRHGVISVTWSVRDVGYWLSTVTSASVAWQQDAATPRLDSIHLIKFVAARSWLAVVVCTEFCISRKFYRW